MFDEQVLNRALAQLDAELGGKDIRALATNPCDTWKRLRPTVVALIDVLNQLGTLFPKLKLAAQALDALRGVLDALCPGSAPTALASRPAPAEPLEMSLERALRPGLAGVPESPCATWARVKPVVAQIIGVLQALSPEIPVLARVVDVLNTLSSLIDALCRTHGAVAALGETAGGPAQIFIWQDDPYLTAIGTDPPVPDQPVAVDVPNNMQPLLKFQIPGTNPPPGQYGTSTPEFRFWNAEAALDRGINYWGEILPSGTQWSADSSPLAVGLDQGEDFNAFYARESGLNFFHGTVDRLQPAITVFSGESPHVVCHELGHAILDAVKPELFDAMSAEVAAFHESFGDMSSMLSALQLASLRDFVLNQTHNRLNVNSRLSQLARQLGWAIRVQVDPDAVDDDCLRNAANRFFYRNPAGLPPNAPASELSSEPHSFSRVFTGAFLDVLADMFAIGPATGGPTASDNLEAIARDAGTLLIEGVRLASVAPGFYSQVAAGMIQADTTLTSGRYASALTTNFIKRGILQTSAAVALVRDLGLVKNNEAFGVTGVFDSKRTLKFAGDNQGYLRTGADAPLLRLAPIHSSLGLTVHVYLPAEPKRFPMASATVVAGVQVARSPEEDAQDFLEDLIQAGQVDHARARDRMAAVPAAAMALSSSATKHKTHYLVQEDDKVVLKRHHFDCGFACGLR